MVGDIKIKEKRNREYKYLVSYLTLFVNEIHEKLSICFFPSGNYFISQKVMEFNIEEEENK